MGLKQREFKVFANIISDGTIRVRCNETDPDAVKREYELKNGQKGVKFEKVYNELSGNITNLAFYDGDFGKVLNLTVTDESDIVLSVSLNSNYAEDLLKKLPNVDLNKQVLFRPYSFNDDNGKIKRGITIIQDNIKVKSYFHDITGKPINGYPDLTKDRKEYDKDEWKIYFIQIRKFLQQYTEEKIIPKFADLNAVENSPVVVTDDDNIEIPEQPFGDVKTETVVAEPTPVVVPEVTSEQKESYIAELAKDKLGVTGADIMRAVMESTQIAYIKPNYDIIIKKLEEMPKK